MHLEQTDFDDLLLQVLLDAGENDPLENNLYIPAVPLNRVKSFRSTYWEPSNNDANNMLALNLARFRDKDVDLLNMTGPTTLHKGLHTINRVRSADDAQIAKKPMILPPPQPYQKNHNGAQLPRCELAPAGRREYNFRIGLSLHVDRMLYFSTKR